MQEQILAALKTALTGSRKVRVTFRFGDVNVLCMAFLVEIAQLGLVKTEQSSEGSGPSFIVDLNVWFIGPNPGFFFASLMAPALENIEVVA